MKTVALFDFDGTLSRGSTVGKFFLLAAGLTPCAIRGMPLLWPALQYASGRTNFVDVFHMTFERLLQGKTKEELEAAGKRLALHISKQRMWEPTRQALLKHCRDGATVAIVTGGLPYCAKAWLELEGLTDKVTLFASVDSFDEKGRALRVEKVMVREDKLMAIEWAKSQQAERIIAYGNSEGDYAMLMASDEKWWVDKKGTLSPWKGML